MLFYIKYKKVNQHFSVHYQNMLHQKFMNLLNDRQYSQAIRDSV